jgi:hypothetical protein
MPLDNSYAPVARNGWQIVEYFYNGDSPRFHSRGCALAWAKEYASNWRASIVFDSSRSELVISPVNGWESIKGDRYLALAWAISEGVISPEMGASQIRAMVEKGEDRDAVTQE